MSFLHKSIVSLAGSFLLGVVNLVIGILLARWLLPEGVGQYQVLISAVTLVGAVLTMGVGQASIYYLNSLKFDPRLVTSIVFKFAFFVSIITALILWAVFQYKPYFGSISFYVMAICAAQGIGLIFLEVLYPILIAFLHVNKFTVIRLFPRIVTLLLMVLAIMFGRLNFGNSLLFVTIGNALGAIYLIYFLRSYISIRSNFDNKLFFSMCNYGFKINLNSIVVIMCGELGVLLLRFFDSGNFAEVGYYSRAIRIGAILLLISSSLSPLLFSKWSAADEVQQKHQAELVNRFFLFFFLIIAVFVVIFAKKMILVLYGVEFIPSAIMLKVLIVGIGARFLLMPIFQVFSSNGFPLLTGIILFVNLCVMTIFMWFLVPEYKGLGAAISFTAGNVAGLILGYLIGHFKFNVKIQNSLLLTMSDMYYLKQGILPKKSPSHNII